MTTTVHRNWRDYDPREIDFTYEIRPLYDGWSIAVLRDGTIINRWANPVLAKDDPTIRHRRTATEQYIANLREQDREDRSEYPSGYLPRHGG